jgi:hypothetical protein
MAELTYDPTPADQPEFNEAEMEAIAIGEAAAREQEAQYAGKFKDAEELEKAYIELQKKLGANDEDGTDEGGLQEQQAEAEEEVEVSPAAELITNASAEYAETGEISSEMMEQFSSMSSQELVDAYVEMQGQLPSQPTADLSESDVNIIKNSVGGEESYQNLMGWAADNMDPADIEAFDALVESGNARSIRLAAAGLRAQYESQNGFEGEMLTGRAPVQQADVFRSQAEVVQAMSDPRYDRDPAYRQDVFEKLDRSNINY